MRAAIHRRYGPPEVLRIEEVPMPSVGRRDVRVRVHASTVTSGDARLRAARTAAIFALPIRLAFGLRGPRRPIPGMEFAGEVEAVGADVTRFRPGEAVFGIVTRGANAEYLTVRDDAAIVPMPPGLTHAEAAAVPFGALAALVFLRDVARLVPGERVLVVGAAGGVGVFAVQIAKHLGAHVTALCSAENAALVRGLGADAVIDRRAGPNGASAGGFDILLDTVGETRFAEWRAALAPRGRHLFLSFGLGEMVRMVLTSVGHGPRALCGFVANDPAALAGIAEMLAAGVLRPVIGSRYRLDDIVEAHRHVDSGRKRGSAVISLIDPC
ncbi:NAD(P)-dependent alcohol dehydrogenase [Roseomonas sp. PWR1]|uniref:NAD(P)-dependent alcohol dehydrogenase n=1 Tax=Roseomonas nitratireducens TaxID=2820810 RepID=A0ABS4APS6_9PROT|nr:NAD(P)-dependent alcohol dehydrogenase [Neoroseomonas nitratireducens]MBP0462868.1 NAD(P)-dependent alcohol dehydrogenase [Neoroseomonas nitratireducens]